MPYWGKMWRKMGINSTQQSIICVTSYPHCQMNMENNISIIQVNNKTYVLYTTSVTFVELFFSVVDQMIRGIIGILRKVLNFIN